MENEGNGKMPRQIEKDEEEMHCVEVEQHFGGVRKFPHFHCGREKPKCNGVNNFKFQTKEHGRVEARSTRISG